MIYEFSTILEKLCQLNKDQTIIVGVSGGPDSLFLLDHLYQYNYPLIIGHLDHMLRPESNEEAEHVRHYARQLGLDFVLENENVSQYAKEKHLSAEEAAREMRYRFLFRLAERYNAQAVAVGHNADDQVETVLMHILRGSGLSGLRGMSYRSLPNPWSDKTALIRPLLGIWRTEIDAYIAKQKLQPNIDMSNLDSKYYRNRLRHELIPYLEKFNSGVCQRLWQMADILHDDDEIIQKIVSAQWKKIVMHESKDYLALNLDVLKAQDSGIQRRIIRRSILKLRPAMRNLDYAAIIRAQQFLEVIPKSAEIDLIANLRLVLFHGTLFLLDWNTTIPVRNFPQIDAGNEIKVPIPSQLELSKGWKIQSEQIKMDKCIFTSIRDNEDPFLAWIDKDRLDFPLVVRTRQKGERFCPHGMEGRSIKLSDYMINKKIPRQARNNYPLIISGKEIVWIPGFQLGHKFQVRTNSEMVIQLQLLYEE
jgi:tRNA(Ile)-lysidine synthase